MRLKEIGAESEAGCAAAPPEVRVEGAGERGEAYERLPGRTDILLVCDHASNFVPPDYGRLGLDPAEFERHIAYDIGAEGLTRALAARLGAAAVLSRFSRLVIDPNRGLDDPTLVMRLSDGAVVPGNAGVDAAERERRIARFYAPYDAALSQAIEDATASGAAPAIFSLHSFTPLWKGAVRPWHAGILWDRDARLARPLIDALRADPALVVGDNEPYSGALPGDTMWRHAAARGLPHALIEIRQDLICEERGIEDWADRLAPILERLARGARNTRGRDA